MPIIVIVGIIGLVIVGPSYAKGGRKSPTPTPIATESPKNCTQVITPAVDPATGQCQEFTSPCEVPVGWQPVPSCENI